jgi:hypothetical protein
VRFRRAALAAATVLVAAFVALAVPVGQLRTFSFSTTCCCPDPTNCHCPQGPHDDGRHDSMKRCHNTIADIVTGATPTVVPPALAVAAVDARPAVAILMPIAAPHASPDPIRPAAPS